MGRPEDSCNHLGGGVLEGRSWGVEVLVKVLVTETPVLDLMNTGDLNVCAFKCNEACQRNTHLDGGVILKDV